MILVSGCLAGIPCRYDGKSKRNAEAAELAEKGLAIPVCPECLGGLPTPREKSEIIGGDGNDVLDGLACVRTRSLRDVTENFISGAEETLRIARAHGAKYAVLRAGSPSCGCGAIYDGSFTGKMREGDGVTAALLKRSGISVVTL